MRFRPHAVIFDIDGTLVDNMALHAEAFAVFAQRHGLPPLTADDRAKLDGRRNSEIFPILFGRDVPRDEWQAYEAEKEGLYRELSRGRLLPVKGLLALIARLIAAAIPMALATSAPEPNVVHTLNELDLTAAFPLIVRGDQVPRGKPAPDVFLEAAIQLAVPPPNCLVFEDAPVGIVAAQAAGMPVVALTTSFDAAHFARLQPPPAATCDDFDLFLERHFA
ncbi:MAG: HAD family phosphatase [Vicinamibacterales bacterium]|jgi:HAD superfamily hydrolase (TIGR01509 family)